MGLTGRLTTGTRIESIPCCDVHSDSCNSHLIRSCGDYARYQVFFPDSDVTYYACEEHAQRLWDTDAESK